MRIARGSVLLDGRFAPADAVTEGERFSAIEHAGEARSDGTSADEVLDAAGCFVIPGLIDLHFHGCMGHDFCDGTPEALDAIARYEASCGVTAICPATMTFPEEVLNPIMDTAAAYRPAPDAAALVGINMEGPYISPGKVGAQNPAFVRVCDIDEFKRLQARSGGLIKLVDVAPEEEGALAFVEQAARSVRVSIAHTCADYECARAAIERGARQMTHLFNAMPPLHHRKPGPIAAAAECEEVAPEIISDGVHIHPAMVRLAFRLFGDDRMILVSDTMRAAGLRDGVYDLGGQEVTVRGKRAMLADGTLAGSVSDLMSCVRTAVRDMGIPLASAVKAATVNPARALGIDGERGSIESGKVADAVILDADLNIKHVIVRGRLLD